MSRILIIDDDFDLCNLLQGNLQHSGEKVDIRLNGAAGIQAAQEKEYQLVILDIFMPGMDGFEVLEQLRAKCNVPILMLTGKDDNASKVKGLQLGADDYLTKPFDLGEFDARVQSLIRRYVVLNDAAQKSVLDFKGMKILLGEKRVTINGTAVALSGLEFDLLVFCAQNQGKILSKKKIFEAVWNQEYLYDDATVMTAISRLRKKLDGAAAPVDYFETIKGMGYRFHDSVSGNKP